MAHLKHKIDAMTFVYETTTQEDYEIPELQPTVRTAYKKKEREDRTMKKKASVKYVHSLSEWNGAPVPFDLLLQPIPITQTNPHHMQAAYGKIQDLELDKVRKTRPRYIISPAVAIDDVADPQSHKILINSSYTTDMKAGYVADQRPSIKAPLNGRYAATRPVALPKWKPPYVSPEWRWETLKWEAKQLKSHCDATKEFWLLHHTSKS